MIFCRIAWMREYRGPDNDYPQYAQDRYIIENGYGFECWNFLPIDKRLFGFVQHPPHAIVKRISGSKNKIDGMTIIWVASKGSLEETYIVGWWKNATVFKKHQIRRDLSKIKENTHIVKAPINYFITCKLNDSFLLSESDRTFPVPRQTGWMAKQSYIFYADGGGQGDKARHLEYKEEVKAYISGHQYQRGTRDNSAGRKQSEGDDSVFEGKPELRTHLIRDRNKRISGQAKRTFKKTNGMLYCEICSFDFSKEFGALGLDFIEAHHIRPLSDGARITHESDFMMLCSNCHRMAHRRIRECGRFITRNETLMLRAKAE